MTNSKRSSLSYINNVNVSHQLDWTGAGFTKANHLFHAVRTQVRTADKCFCGYLLLISYWLYVHLFIRSPSVME